MVPLKDLHPAPWNPRTIKDERFKNLVRSIEADPDFLWRRPLLAMADGTIYAGNMRYRAAEFLKLPAIPAIVEDVSDLLAKERALRDNQQWGEWVDEDVAALLLEVREAGSDIDLLGFSSEEVTTLLEQAEANANAAGREGEQSEAAVKLSDRFLFPPFSVLNAREGIWQDRKRAWISLGIKSELGRGENLQGLSDQNELFRQGLDPFNPSQKRRPTATPGGSALPAAKTRGDIRYVGTEEEGN